jgi:hypothetical protein
VDGGEIGGAKSEKRKAKSEKLTQRSPRPGGVNAERRGHREEEAERVKE